jgi:PadR family transcriptional regulator
MVDPVRITVPLRIVLGTLLEHASREVYGLELAAATGLKSGSLYPVLARLERAGWVSSRWEENPPEALGRPRRRFYQLTAAGATRASAVLASTPTQLAKRLQLGTES